MLSVVWSSQGEWFSTDAAVVLEVVPLVAARAIAGTPDWFVGLADHHGRLVPILDADRLLGRDAAPATLATRVLIVELRCEGELRTVGLRVEAVRGIERVDLGDPDGHGGLRSPDMPHLGEVVAHGGDTVQRVDLARWLEGERGELLFGGGAAAETESDPAPASSSGDAP